MSSVVDPQPDPADELVAYLDGELPPTDCRRVETRLATDENYRQQLHELDQTWEALDALPAPTVDDNFARTTIELACVAAESDLKEHTAVATVAKRSRMRRWVAAAVAAVVVGFFIGEALVPNHNEQLVNDLPAIHQFAALLSVDDVDFLRQLSKAVPRDQLIKDEPSFESRVKELESANSTSLETRREWIQSLSPEKKAEIADRARAFADLEPSSADQQRMREVMEEIRNDSDAAELQKTLIAYGQWVSRHSAAQHQQLRDEIHGLAPDKQAEVVKRLVERENQLALHHLSPDDADALRQEIFLIVKERKPEFIERNLQGRKIDRALNVEAPVARQVAVALVTELFKGNKREETQKRLVDKLSPQAQAHFQSLGRGQRDFNRAAQLWVWIQDAMRLKVDPEELERFFTNDKKLSNDRRQQLLDEPRARMEVDLKREYLRSEMGIENPGQLFGEFGELGRMPRPGIGRPDGPKRSEAGGPGGMRRGQRRPPGPDGGPDRPPERPLQPGPNPGPDQPPPPKKQEAI